METQLAALTNHSLGQGRPIYGSRAARDPRGKYLRSSITRVLSVTEYNKHQKKKVFGSNIDVK
jgi:hypothetical protein